MAKPISERTGCDYFLPEPPCSVQAVRPPADGGPLPRVKEGHCLWSSDYPVPSIGEEVVVRLNNAGRGFVTSYFVEHGFLGLHVALDKPREIPQHKAGCRDVMAFGCDLQR